MKEKLIRFTRNNKNKKIVSMIAWTIIIVAAILVGINSYVVRISELLVGIISIVGIVALLVKKGMQVLFEQEEKVIKENKIILILFSNKDFMSYLVYIILLPLILIGLPKLCISLWMIICILLGIIVIFLSRIISKYFLKKIKK